jgi:predicted  nucleic acid-binding Zn-ribbon protein
LRLKLIVTSLFLLCLLSGSCASAQSFDSSLKSIVKPYRFSIAQWELKAIPYEAKQWLSHKETDQTNTVLGYFSLVEQIKRLESEIAMINTGTKQGDLASLEAELDELEEQRMALAGKVEKIIAGQIKEILAEQGIYHPVDKYIRLKVSFPPLDFKLEEPLHLLVVSPRDRIESIREIILQPNLSVEEMEEIEAKVDKLGVSSLVVELGGLGATYPTFVTDNASLQFTINTATEEWLHQYLAFNPLGFLYLLDVTGVSRNYEIATMNEALASMVSKEIGAMVCQKYYPGYEDNAQQEEVADSEFDFNQEMREIRRTVDNYLAQGEITQAEEFMEQKRQYLVSMGYQIRKLNQAYFAFYGTYADSPTSVSPIGVELQELREQSASLKDFLDTVAAMTSQQDLIAAIK